MSKLQYILIPTDDFLPNDEFENCIEALGYNGFDELNTTLLLDKRLISFIQNNSDEHEVYYGKQGHINVGLVDLSRNWYVSSDRYAKNEHNKIVYYNLTKDKYNRIVGFTH